MKKSNKESESKETRKRRKEVRGIKITKQGKRCSFGLWIRFVYIRKK